MRSEEYAHAIFRGYSEAESGADRVAELLEGGQLLGKPGWGTWKPGWGTWLRQV
jgi:hypothetical protein